MPVFNELIDLLMPTRCAVCDKSGSELCEKCRVVLVGSGKLTQIEDLEIYYLVEYSEELSKLLVAFKEKGQASLAKAIAHAMMGAEKRPVIEGQVILIPAPSRKANFRKRGYQPALLLANQLAFQEENLRVRNCLHFVKQVSDQVGLEAGQRRANVSGAMRSTLSLVGENCLIIDDVVTTGATVLESARSLRESGAKVLGVWAMARAGSVNEVSKIGLAL